MRRLRAELDLSEPARLLPAAGVLAVWAAMMFDAGGFRPAAWLPGGLLIVGLLALAVIGAGRALPAAGPARTALLLLLAFTGWCYLSIAWSDAPGLAWEASNLLLVSVLGAWVLVLAPWRTRTAQGLLMVFSIAAAAACLAAMLGALSAADLTTKFEDFRFSPPLDYPNTTAAFALMAALPALLQAARPDASIAVKAAAQGLATFLCAYALLPQSRGAILGGIAAVAILFLAVPFRWRLFLRTLLLALALLGAAGPVGDLYTIAAETGKASEALGDAFTAILLATLAGVVFGAALAVGEQRFRREDEWAGAARRATVVLAAGGVLAVAAVGVANSAAISDVVSDQWRALKNPGEDFAGKRADSGGSRLLSVDPLARYDYWRVALDGFRSNPLGGMGAGGFEHRYALERRDPRPSRYPHNVVMKVVGDTGLVGVALMLAFLVVVVRGLVLGARRRTTRERVVYAGAAAMLGYFLAHGLFDWVEAYPVLVGPALASPLVALAVRHRADQLKRPGAESPRPRRIGWLSAAAVCVLAAASLLAPWLALRYRERAADVWRADPAAAYRDLERAASLDPLSPDALVQRGVIGLSRGELELARSAFQDAIARQQEWLPHFGLAIVAVLEGDRVEAEREVAIARRQHRADPRFPDVAERLLSGEPVDPDRLLRDALDAPADDVEPIS